MTAPDRPALAGVLACLTGTLPEQWAPESYRVTSVTSRWVGRRHPPEGMGVDGGVPLSITDSREALEALQARDLAPEDDERRGFSAVVFIGSLPHAERRSDAPQSIHDLVAWASLGRATIATAEALAREIYQTTRGWQSHWPPCERVVWRVGPRGKGSDSLWGGVLTRDGGGATPVPAIADLWELGLAIDSITPHAVTMVCPPIGGER